LELAHNFFENGHSVGIYGVSEKCDPKLTNLDAFRAVNIQKEENNITSFDMIYQSESSLKIHLQLPGMHNIQNAIASVLAVNAAGAWEPSIGIFFENAPKALETFKPTARRFDMRADVNGIAIVDDYAHNPMSIKAVLDAARQRYPERVVWAVWQPHTFSRTQALFDQFVVAFDEADHVLITDIYAAREAPIEGVSSAAVVEAMKHPDVRHTPNFADVVAVLLENVKAPAVIVIMSAGDAPDIGVQYLKLLQEAT
jgi:UDP-N-acetylmuramate--alanine ligase